MTDEMPISEGLNPRKSALKDDMAKVSEALNGVADNVVAAVEAGKRPGMPLDILAQATRQAPLASLFVAFLVGIAVTRRH